MRNIPVSTDVFAAIWAARQAGEETEEAILRRILRVGGDASPDAVHQPASGMTISGVHLPEGFKVFRTYKGKYIEAVVESGKLRLSLNNGLYDSFNKISQAVIEGAAENAWWAWRYIDESGQEHAINHLRG